MQMPLRITSAYDCVLRIEVESELQEFKTDVHSCNLSSLFPRL
jgi:hypothetical protein